MSNPYAPPNAVSENVLVTEPRERSSWLVRLCSLQVVVIAVALMFEAYDHETIVGSGPIFALVGLAIAIIAFRRNAMLEMMLGLSAIFLSLLVVFLINYNEWTPGESDRPNSIVITAYALAAVPALLIAIARQLKGRRRSNAEQSKTSV